MSKLKTFRKPQLACIYYSNRAAAYMRLSRYKEAASDCEEALLVRYECFLWVCVFCTIYIYIYIYICCWRI
jgi:hypothetical protein